jgi:hypothetical protein
MERTVVLISKKEATRLVIKNHYMHRRPPISYAFGLIVDGATLGVVTFGTPASRHMQIGACPSSPESVVELNRLWICDSLPRNSETWFLAQVFRKLPPLIVLSYADTAEGHMGYVYRAANFYYAGWTDMERKTARFDYVVPGLHTRDAFRKGEIRFTDRVRRRPKVKYWTTTGDRRQRRALKQKCLWPVLDWKLLPPPTEHRKLEGEAA